VKVPDRAEAATEQGDALSKRLQELRKKAEELRKKVPPPERSKPPPHSSRGRLAGGLASAGPAIGRPAPKLLKALRTVADRWRSGRAAFTETVGREASRQTATGTIYLGKGRKFAIERILKLRAAQAIKELRVFDGQTLWAQTTTREFGHSVRRCDRDAARKHWRAVDGRPEVDFATVANPVQAWRLFGDDLVHLGIERLANEGAYVFEIRPDKKLEPVLTGPLSSEVLYKAAGRRVRFWIGAESGFQLRMRVYDDGGNVLASLECADLELDAHIPPDLFAYKVPPGVKVTDVNAAIADGDRTPAPAAP
jgi:outer membrane lipoprotein-sorting protein